MISNLEKRQDDCTLFYSNIIEKRVEKLLNLCQNRIIDFFCIFFIFSVLNLLKKLHIHTKVALMHHLHDLAPSLASVLIINILSYIRGVGGPENDNFPLHYVVKMSLLRWVGGSKKPQNTLT